MLISVGLRGEREEHLQESLTGEMANAIRQFPKVIEEADYQAGCLSVIKHCN